jgi:alkylhydroperoxidase family enzyme
MIRQLAHKLIDRPERVLGARLDYLRQIADHSPAALGKIALLVPAGTHRSKLPTDAFHLARLQATLHEDCASCVEIELNLARRHRVPESILCAVLETRLNNLPPDLASICRFAEAVVTRNGEEAHLREHLVRRYGEEEVIELALAIAMARVFPTLKRGLGFAERCSPSSGYLPNRATPTRSPSRPEIIAPLVPLSQSDHSSI